MADAVLYYRTESTLVTSIDSLPITQRLIFDFPNDILEGINEVYENRINPQQSVNSQGIRRIFNRDDGLKGRRFILKGRMKKVSTDIPRLKAFRKLPSTTTTLVNGIFGMRIDNADFYDQDPTSQRGLMIGRMAIGYLGQKSTRHDFEIELFFGGEHE